MGDLAATKNALVVFVGGAGTRRGGGSGDVGGVGGNERTPEAGVRLRISTVP